MMHAVTGGAGVGLVLLCVCASVATAQRYTLPWWHPWTQALARSHTTKRDHSPIFNLINPTIRAHTRESHSGDIDCPNGFLCDGEYVTPTRCFDENMFSLLSRADVALCCCMLLLSVACCMLNVVVVVVVVVTPVHCIGWLWFPGAIADSAFVVSGNAFPLIDTLEIILIWINTLFQRHLRRV